MNNQQMMNVNDMVQELSGLQQQLLYLGNNPQAQAQVNARINELQNGIRYMQQQQQQQQMGYQQQGYQQQQQPVMAYQQQQQPAYQQQPQQPFNPMMNMSNNQSIDTSISKNSRFTRHNTKRMEQHTITPPQAQEQVYQQPEPPAPSNIPKKPQPGNEFPFLLANGLETEIKDLGDYFEYEIIGNSDMIYSKDVTVIDEKSITPKLTSKDVYTTMLFHCLKEHKQSAIYRADTNFSIAEKIAFDAGEFVKQFSEIDTLEELAALLKSKPSSLFINIFNKKLTKLINDALRYVAVAKQDIDDFIGDISELTKLFIPEIKEVKLRKRFMLALSSCIATVKSWDIHFEESENIITWELTQPKPVLYTIDKNYIEDMIDGMESNDVLAVTPDAHHDLYELLGEVHKTLHTRGEFVVGHINKDGTAREYKVNKTYKGLYIIRKENV